MSYVLVHFDSHAEVGFQCDFAGCKKRRYTEQVYDILAREEAAALGWRVGVPKKPYGYLDYCPEHGHLMDGDTESQNIPEKSLRPAVIRDNGATSSQSYPSRDESSPATVGDQS